MGDIFSKAKHGLKFNIAMLAHGKLWWVVHGNSTVAGCVSCQRHIHAEKGSVWWYDYTTLLPLATADTSILRCARSRA